MFTKSVLTLALTVFTVTTYAQTESSIEQSYETRLAQINALFQQRIERVEIERKAHAEQLNQRTEFLISEQKRQADFEFKRREAAEIDRLKIEQIEIARQQTLAEQRFKDEQENQGFVRKLKRNLFSLVVGEDAPVKSEKTVETSSYFASATGWVTSYFK